MADSRPRLSLHAASATPPPTSWRPSSPSSRAPRRACASPPGWARSRPPSPSWRRPGRGLVAATKIYGQTHHMACARPGRPAGRHRTTRRRCARRSRAPPWSSSRRSRTRTWPSPTSRRWPRSRTPPGARLVVDNTIATPIGCRPLEHGADLVFHSATKYLNGHSDVLAGVAAGPADLIARLAERSLDLGATLAPDSAWLVRRGIRTLHLRLERASAERRRHRRVPGRASACAPRALPGPPLAPLPRGRLPHPRRLRRPADVRGRGRPAGGEAVMDRVALCLRATSLGGVETCISHPASTSHRQLSAAQLERGRHRRGRPAADGRLRGRRRPDRRPGAGASLTDAPAPRLSPWWMLAPALLFIANFIGGLRHERPVGEEHRLQRHGDRRHRRSSTCVLIVYVALRRVGVAAADRARRSRCGARRFARRSSWAALAAVLVDRLEPACSTRCCTPSQRQGIAPTHDPRSTHQWVVLAIAVVGLVLVAPAAEELVFRGLGFATLGRFALPADDGALRPRPRPRRCC